MIHHAVAYGPKETIQFLLESRQQIGFNIEERTINGSTILHTACAYRDIEIIDLVFDALEKVNSDIDFDTRVEGSLPMHHSCMNKNSDAAIHLIRRYPQKMNVLNRQQLASQWLAYFALCLCIWSFESDQVPFRRPKP